MSSQQSIYVPIFSLFPFDLILLPTMSVLLPSLSACWDLLFLLLRSSMSRLVVSPCTPSCQPKTRNLFTYHCRPISESIRSLTIAVQGQNHTLNVIILLRFRFGGETERAQNWHDDRHTNVPSEPWKTKSNPAVEETPLIRLISSYIRIKKPRNETYEVQVHLETFRHVIVCQSYMIYCISISLRLFHTMHWHFKICFYDILNLWGEKAIWIGFDITRIWYHEQQRSMI